VDGDREDGDRLKEKSLDILVCGVVDVGVFGEGDAPDLLLKGFGCGID